MRLSIEGWIRNRVGDIAAFEMIKAAGFDAVDYSFYWPKAGMEMLDGDYAAYARTLRRHLDAIGLVCNQAHAPFDLRYGEPWEMSCPAYRNIVRSMEFAAILGAEQIVVHSLGVPRGVDVMAYNEAYYKSLEPYCAQYGIRIAIENLFEEDKKRRTHIGRIGTAALLREMLSRLDSPWFVLCVDVGHAALSGTEPEDMIRALDTHCLRALHIQDTDYLKDCHIPPYMGLLNWDEIASALREIRYQGDLTLEVFSYLLHMEDALLPDALHMAAKIGRHLSGKIEKEEGA